MVVFDKGACHSSLKIQETKSFDASGHFVERKIAIVWNQDRYSSLVGTLDLIEGLKPSRWVVLKEMVRFEESFPGP